ncbi:hypothetical protein CONLIGDRAFT_569981 [Coniochaeta ligniaria NRRL 30616]|uniref:Uncharacterized protein n=1 Tax=Coniochaeta ligniaria NRRL 30616 TaxID=1408157 RepID=A0A1J7J2U9_9PEZI|nr:hypothetical protein CONLIGDRAFT_569981 [Coniochaeta ligniaria NRRL 30616]
MATVQQHSDGNPDDLREEARLEDSLEHLKELHLKLRALRTTIPRMVDPLRATHPSPTTFFSSFKKSVADAHKEIADIRAALTSEESKKLLDEANASRLAKPKGIRPWRATDDPNWTTPRKRKT